MAVFKAPMFRLDIDLSYGVLNGADVAALCPILVTWSTQRVFPCTHCIDRVEAFL